MLLAITITALLTGLTLIVLQNFRTPEKSIEHKVEHRYASSDPQFQREMSALLGPAIVHGNHVTQLLNGDEIFPAMLDAINSAQTSITFETYIYWSGDIGEKVSAALSSRAQAGIAVSVILDWVGSARIEQSLVDTMEAAGVQIHRYHPLHWYDLARINYRTHRKLLVIDGRIGFTGGVGIADQWSGHGQDAEHWRDTHFRIEGPVVGQLQAAFNDNWIKTTGHVLNGEEYFPALTSSGDMAAHVFVASPSGGSESMHLMYLLAIAAADTAIDLAAAYFVPDELLINALIAARGRGVRVRILVPGPHIDSLTVKLASKASWGNLLHAGVEIFVYQPTMMHSKLLIIDQLFVSVGSTNFDMRSIRLNDEASVNIYDRNFAKTMIEIFENDLRHAELYTLARWKARPWHEKLSEKIVYPIRSQL